MRNNQIYTLDDLSKILKMVNINLYNHNGELKHVLEILSDLYPIWDNLDQNIKKEITKIIINLEQINK
jgi:hypothetical protein